MHPEVEGMLIWIQICVVLAAIFSTAFPVLYAFSPWWKSWLGRALMIQAVAFAMAIDLTAFFLFWPPESIMVAVWTNVVTFSLIATATGFLTWKLFKHNYLLPYRAEKEHQLHGR